MSHQDFKEIILKRPQTKQELKHKNVIKAPNYERTVEQKLNQETERLDNERVGSALGKKIQVARLAAGFKTQKDLANKIKIRPEILSQYENGKAIRDTQFNHIMQLLRKHLNTTF